MFTWSYSRCCTSRTPGWISNYVVKLATEFSCRDSVPKNARSTDTAISIKGM